MLSSLIGVLSDDVEGLSGFLVPLTVYFERWVDLHLTTGFIVVVCRLPPSRL